MSKTKRGVHPSRRQVIAAGAGVGALAIIGCGGSSGGDGDGGGGGSPDGGPGWVDPGDPEIASNLWQTMAAFARATADGAHGTRINLYNPASAAQRVVLQVFRSDGELVVKDEIFSAFPAGQSHHIELGDYLRSKGVELPFEGSLWVGTTPESGPVFMGLQGIGFDWYGPAHLASVHGMRDFGNSGREFSDDQMWSDLILPKVTVGSRFVTKVAVLNVSGDGVSEALNATPEVIVRDDAGTELAQTTLSSLPPYSSVLVDLGDLIDEPLDAGTIQIRESEAGLVAVGFIFDKDNDGIVNADHFFDRHFVTHFTGFG